jgi:hypothetical protein
MVKPRPQWMGLFCPFNLFMLSEYLHIIKHLNMDYSEDILRLVKEYGKHQLLINDIIELVQPLNETQFKIDFFDENSALHLAYLKGSSTTQERLDEELLKIRQITVDENQIKLDKFKEYQALRGDLFGV